MITCFVCLFWIYFFIHNIWKIFNISLWLSIKRNKRKFYYIRAKVSLWEDDGRYEFGLPEQYKQIYQDYLKNHTTEINQLVEMLKTEIDGVYYFAAVDREGKWDWAFRDASRRSFSMFHINKQLVLEMKPTGFSWKNGCLMY